MTKQLRDLLERADTWPLEAQEALRRAALAIEQSLASSATDQDGKSLRDIMLSAPLDGVDIDRRSVYPQVRDVNL